ncbi:MAG: hypothetical protein H6631_20395 [Anaerolineaceae bacterium]|nr:hypothetical protein [Anaerolineaceae bacterium]
MLALEAATEDNPISPVETSPSPVTIDHVVDACRRYPGELALFYTRLSIQEAVGQLTVRMSLPDIFTLENYQVEAGPSQIQVKTELTADLAYLVWSLPNELPAGTEIEVQTAVRVCSVEWDSQFESQAVVTNSDLGVLASETAVISVLAHARYLQHLPAIFEQDSLLGRLLMLFESFWEPIEHQIEQSHAYLDPRLTPTSFLPWLASWLDLTLDEDWPEARQRQLIRWAIALHRSRGTKWGLQKYLEIYTGQPAVITEFRAKNFALGVDSRLGLGLALGRGNSPHTFNVTLRLPAIDAENEAERGRQQAVRRRTIEAIIDRQKPAHTVYTLNLEPLEPDKPAETAPSATSPVKDEIDELAAIWFKLEN